MFLIFVNEYDMDFIIYIVWYDNIIVSACDYVVDSNTKQFIRFILQNILKIFK